MKKHTLLLACLTTALAVGSLHTHAASLWWDPVPGTPGPGDAAGTWGNAASNLNWWDGTANVPWSPDALAVVGFNTATATTVTLTNPIVASSLVFSNLGSAAYTVIGGAAGNLGLALGTNLTLAGASPAVVLAAHDVTQGQVVDIVSASVIAPDGLSVQAATTSTNGFVRFGHATNYIAGSLTIGTPGTAGYGGTSALFCDFNTPTDSAAVGINFVLTGATNVTVYSNATLRISNQNGSQWNPAFPKNLTISGDGRNGIAGAWVITGNGNGIFNGNVILAGDSTIEINSGTAGRVYTLSQPITGQGRLQIVCGSAGKHTLQLTNASTYTGNTIIAGGTTLRLQSGSDRLPAGTSLTLGASATPVANWNREGSLILGNAASAVSQTLAGLRSDTAGLDYLCRVIGGNTTNVSWLAVNQSGSNFYGGAIGGLATADRNLGLILNGGTLVLAGTNLANGGFTVASGVLQFGDGMVDAPLAGPLTNHGTVVFQPSTSLTLADAIRGSGSLVKRGFGSLTLAGAQDYTGATMIESGKLTLTTAKTGSGAITVASTANLEIQRTAATASITAASVALDTARLDFNFNNLGLNATAPLKVTGNLGNSGFTQIYIAAPGNLSVGTYPLIQYGSFTSAPFASLSLGAPISPRVSAVIQDNPVTKTIDLVVTSVDFLKWTGATDGSWDTSTPNWLLSSSGLAATYAPGDFARFDDSATGTTLLSVVMDPSPGLMVVSNQAKPYTFGGFSGIGGNGGLIKEGAGTLTLANFFNTYAGGTTIRGGTLQVGDGVMDSTLPDGVENHAALVFNVSGINTANRISGPGTLTKQGWGELTLGGENTYDGATAVNAGTLRVTSSTALGSAAGGTTVAPGAELWVDAGGLNLPEPLTVQGEGALGAGALQARTGASTWSGPVALTGDTVLGAAVGASLTLTSGIEAASHHPLVNANNTGFFNVAGPLAGTAITLTNTGGLLLSAANPTLTQVRNLGPVTPGSSPPTTSGIWARNDWALGTNSIVILTNDTHIGDTGVRLGLDNNVSIPNGVALRAYSPGEGQAGPGGYRSTLAVVSSTTNVWNGPITLHGADPALGVTSLFILSGGNSGTAGRLIVNGDITVASGVINLLPRGWGSGQFNGRINLGTNAYSQTDGARWTVASTGNLWGLTQIGSSSSILALGADNALCPTAPLNFLQPGTWDLDGFNQSLPGLYGPGGTVVNHSTQTHSTLTLTGPGEWTFGGSLVLSGVAGAKQLGLDLAGGKLTLTGTGNSYAGPTTIRNGATLALSGSGRVSVSAIEVQAGGTLDVAARTDGTLALGEASPSQILSGNGTVLGSVNNRGTISPSSSIGTLTVTGDVTGTAEGRLWLEVNNAAATKDLLQVTGALTYAGTLVITNVSATPYAVGQVLKLFHAGSYSGSFSSIVFPGVTSYDAAQLTVDGTIKVLATIPTTPTALTFAVSQGELTIGWPASYTGWRLETQANSLSIGLSTNWVTVPGSTAVNSMTFPLDPSAGAVFYRLVYP